MSLGPVRAAWLSDGESVSLVLGITTSGHLDEDTVAFLEDANPVYTPAHYSGTLIRTMEG